MVSELFGNEDSHTRARARVKQTENSLAIIAYYRSNV
jgi:hypothetical protein